MGKGLGYVFNYKDKDGNGNGSEKSKCLCSALEAYITEKTGDCDDEDKGFYLWKNRCNGNNLETCHKDGYMTTTAYGDFECKDGKCAVPVILIYAGDLYNCALKTKGCVRVRILVANLVMEQEDILITNPPRNRFNALKEHLCSQQVAFTPVL